MRSFSGSVDSSKWNCPSSQLKMLYTISLTWNCTPSHRSFGPRAPISIRALPWRLPLVMALMDASYSSTVIFPSRSRISPRRSLGRLLEANTTRPSLR